jgi:hypothetical protein
MTTVYGIVALGVTVGSTFWVGIVSFWAKAGHRGFIKRLTSKKFTVELKVYVAHYQL